MVSYVLFGGLTTLIKQLSYFIFDLPVHNFLFFLIGVKHLTAKLATNISVIIFNYIASRFVVFRKKNHLHEFQLIMIKQTLQ